MLLSIPIVIDSACTYLIKFIFLKLLLQLYKVTLFQTCVGFINNKKESVPVKFINFSAELILKKYIMKKHNNFNFDECLFY